MSEFVQHVKRLTKPIASRLGQLDIELTERCNNNCIHCCINLPVDDTEARHREMTTAQVKDVLRQAADLGCLKVRFTGGEPLLCPDFEALYLFSRRLGLKVLLFTNGRLITPHLADLFARIPPLVQIEITVYGMHRESYEAVTRSPGSFAEFQHGVDLLVERNVPFVVKSALLPQNKSEMAEFETWVRTIPWMTRRPGYSMFFNLRHRRDDAQKNRLIESLRISPQEGVAVLTRDGAKYLKEMAEFASKFMRPTGDQLFGCGAGTAQGMCIDAYGRSQPCMGVRAPQLTVDVVGAQHAAPLQSAIAEFTYLSDLRATNSEYLRRCARCFLKGLCEQCPAKSWAEHGTLDTPVEYLCEVAHAQARHLGWLGENEHGWEVRHEVWWKRIESIPAE
jgi:radical SAM protein with 4Fe4S-binding SPASM domain